MGVGVGEGRVERGLLLLVVVRVVVVMVVEVVAGQRAGVHAV